MTKSHYLKIFKSQYLIEFLRYGPYFLHVVINLLGFKITFSNMGAHSAPSLGGSNILIFEILSEKNRNKGFCERHFHFSGSDFTAISGLLSLKNLTSYLVSHFKSEFGG